MNDEQILPWEKLPSDTECSWHAFKHYRDISPRSLDKAYQQHMAVCRQRPGAGRAPGRWEEWTSRHNWHGRALAYDRHLDRLARQAREKLLLETKDRHAALAAGYLSVASVPLKAAAEIFKDPKQIAALAASPDLLSAVRSFAQVIPALIQVERLSRGMTTESVEVEDKRDWRLADRAKNDPEVAKLLTEVVARLAEDAKSEG